MEDLTLIVIMVNKYSAITVSAKNHIKDMISLTPQNNPIIFPMSWIRSRGLVRG